VKAAFLTGAVPRFLTTVILYMEICNDWPYLSSFNVYC
jgi:hypothetical protein